MLPPEKAPRGLGKGALCPCLLWFLAEAAGLAQVVGSGGQPWGCAPPLSLSCVPAPLWPEPRPKRAGHVSFPHPPPPVRSPAHSCPRSGPLMGEWTKHPAVVLWWGWPSTAAGMPRERRPANQWEERSEGGGKPTGKPLAVLLAGGGGDKPRERRAGRWLCYHLRNARTQLQSLVSQRLTPRSDRYWISGVSILRQSFRCCLLIRFFRL